MLAPVRSTVALRTDGGFGSALWMSRSQLAIVSASFLAALAVAGGATAEPASVSSKQAQAESVMAQIQALDGSLEHAVDAYNLANERLDAIRGDLNENRVNLRIAAENLGTAQKVLAARMVAIYTTDQRDSTLDVLVGSSSLEDLLDGLNEFRPHVVHFSGHSGDGFTLFDNGSVEEPEGRGVSIDGARNAAR